MAGHKTESEIKHNTDLGSFLMSWVMAGSEMKSEVWFPSLPVSTMTLILWLAMTRQGAHKVESPGRAGWALFSDGRWSAVASMVDSSCLHVCGCFRVWVGDLVFFLFLSLHSALLSCLLCHVLGCHSAWGVHCSTSLVHLMKGWWSAVPLLTW